jgi:hypothetical protein
MGRACEAWAYPLNTVDDDAFFVPMADGRRAYYSSAQRWWLWFERYLSGGYARDHQRNAIGSVERIHHFC